MNTSVQVPIFYNGTYPELITKKHENLNHG